MKFAAALLLVGASGCWVPNDRGRQMEARITRLEGEAERIAAATGATGRSLRLVSSEASYPR